MKLRAALFLAFFTVFHLAPAFADDDGADAVSILEVKRDEMRKEHLGLVMRIQFYQNQMVGATQAAQKKSLADIQDAKTKVQFKEIELSHTQAMLEIRRNRYIENMMDKAGPLVTPAEQALKQKIDNERSPEHSDFTEADQVDLIAQLKTSVSSSDPRQSQNSAKAALSAASEAASGVAVNSAK
jgi:hypothetical protein